MENVLIGNLERWKSANKIRTVQTAYGLVAFSNSGDALGIVEKQDNGYVLRRYGEPKVAEYSEDDFVSRNLSIAGSPFELFGNVKDNQKEIVLPSDLSGTGDSERIIDANYWLPKAAEYYNISPKLSDYVIVPIPALFDNIPNTNGEAISFEQLTRFVPEQRQLMYKTWRGCGTYAEHQQNTIPHLAKGVILDVFLKRMPKFGNHWKVVQLLAFDRNKDYQLAEDILKKRSNAYSVGYLYNRYTCSICGHAVGKSIGMKPCEHTQLRQRTRLMPNGRLAYRNCEEAVGLECSAVKNPAYVTAIGPHVFDPRNV